MTEQVQNDNSFEQAGPIVSVNDRGGESSGFAVKVAFSVLVAVIMFIGIVYSINRYRAARAAEQAQVQLPQKSDNRSADTVGRRVFSSDPPALPEGASAGSNSATAAKPQQTTADARCGDRSASVVLMGADQQPMRTADGRELRICRNGQLIIPGVQYDTPSASAAAQHPSPAMPRQATKPPTRYGGNIVLPPSKAALALTAAQQQNSATPGFQQASLEGIPNNLSGTGSATHQAIPVRPEAAQTASLGIPPMPAGSTNQGGNAVKASKLTDRDLVLPQDRSIDCNLSMRLVSEVAGRAVCVLSSYVYGDTGRVVLAEPGTVVSGEYGAVTSQGQRRVYIIWTRMKTPRGVIINLDSPAADAMGTSGLTGTVDNRWPERIGAAFLLSLVEDAISYQTAKDANTGGSNAGGGIAVLSQSSRTGEQMAEKVLDSTINIKPTIYLQPGDRATIMVARDLDFRSVYELRIR